MREPALGCPAVTCLAIALVLGTAPALAAEGRTGIAFPTTIRQPGHYILLRDLTVMGSTAITIAAHDVTLDLNGHTLTAACQDLQSPGVVAVDTSLAFHGIHVLNGRIRGGCRGIMADGRFTGNRPEVSISNLDIRGPANGGILLIATSFAIVENSHVADTTVGIIVDGSGTPWSGKVTGNQVERILRTGIGVTDLTGGEVLSNRVRVDGLGGGSWPGLVIDQNPGTSGAGGTLVAHNTAIGGSEGDSVGISVDTPNCLVTGNIATGHGGPWGLRSSGDFNRLEGNVVTRNAHAGIRVFGSATSYSHLEGNEVRGNGGCGITFDGVLGNSYRNNIGGANGASGPACIPAGNIDAGGNIDL